MARGKCAACVFFWRARVVKVPQSGGARARAQVAGATLGDLAEPAVTFVDCEDHFAIEYSKRWSRTRAFAESLAFLCRFKGSRHTTR